MPNTDPKSPVLQISEKVSGDWLIDWKIIYCFTPRSRIIHLYGDVTIAGEGLQNLGLCSALRAFEQGGIFIVPHLLYMWYGASVFSVSSEGPPHSVASYNTRGDVDFCKMTFYIQNVTVYMLIAFVWYKNGNVLQNMFSFKAKYCVLKGILIRTMHSCNSTFSYFE
jgi:hypothetical protein